MTDIANIGKPADIKQLLSFVSEAQSAHSEWRRQSWEDYEFRDGQHWTRSAHQKLVDKGINPLTINRIFPVLNLLKGHFIRNQQDIIAKGRTKQDNELAQVMSEAFAFVKDQNHGAQLCTRAFEDEITAGLGFIEVGRNPDPRQEVVQWRRQPWYTLWWDPYADPFLDKETCRYAFTAPWKDLEDLILLFPEKRKEIFEKFAHLTNEHYVPEIYDPGTDVEEYHRHLSSNHWVNAERKRVRPIEMWYTVITKSLFAVMPDSRVIDIDGLEDPTAQLDVVRHARELVSAHVKKMRVATFMSDLLLQDIPSPYAHDKYPYVPFVGYLDRWNQPFGVPRQLKEQAMEVNKRRSMALALVSNRRVIVEEGAAKDINKVYSEANRHDGFIVLKKGQKNNFEIQEMDGLASSQIDLMHQSEREIQEIAGVNDEALGKESKLQSGIALEKKEHQSSAVTLSLLDNAVHAQRVLGELTTAMVQSEWTGPKVLRVVDRMSGAEKFVEINQKVYDENKGAIDIRNNITEARFDIVTALAPITDTMREKNMELLFSAINKAPPEAVGPLLHMAFEISDIPGKDALLKQVRESTGLPPLDEDLTQEQREAVEHQRKMQKDQAAAEEAQIKKAEREADIAETVAKAEKLRAEAAAAQRDTEREDWKTGHDLGQEILKSMEGTDDS